MPGTTVARADDHGRCIHAHACVGRACGDRLARVKEMKMCFRHGLLCLTLPWLPARARAICLWRVILFRHGFENDPATFWHEYGHYLQFRDDLLFVLKYSYCHLKYGYEENPYEKEAEQYSLTRIAAGDDVCI